MRERERETARKEGVPVSCVEHHVPSPILHLSSLQLLLFLTTGVVGNFYFPRDFARFGHPVECQPTTYHPSEHVACIGLEWGQEGFKVPRSSIFGMQLAPSQEPLDGGALANEAMANKAKTLEAVASRVRLCRICDERASPITAM